MEQRELKKIMNSDSDQIFFESGSSSG